MSAAQNVAEQTSAKWRITHRCTVAENATCSPIAKTMAISAKGITPNVTQSAKKNFTTGSVLGKLRDETGNTETGGVGNGNEHLH